ncbi:uncharacterized protein TNCV_5119871 [Trichonephila clavipes]|nr:uncharacterized protein TNCV_5119871 [Trichonephila clavipes]
MSVNPYDVQVEKLVYWVVQKCTGTRLLDFKSKTVPKKLRDLGDSMLLRKCFHGKAQNPNTNGQIPPIWSVIPRSTIVELKTLKLGTGGRSEPAPVNRLGVPLFGVPKRHCCRVRAAEKGCRVYPLDPRPDAVALYSGCTPADSKLCPKWRTEKQIQEIKTNKNISYPEARKLIVTQTSQTYAQVTKTSTATTATQTDEAITKIACPALKLLQPLRSVPKPTIFSLVPAVFKSSTSTQAQLLPSTSSVIVTSSSKSQPPIPLKILLPSHLII